MNNRKIPIDLDCGIHLYMLALGGKWKPCIINCILNNIKRPHEIHKEMSYASARVLNMQLKELVENGVIYKNIFPGLPLKVEYELTELGDSLIPIIEAMDQWGETNREKILQEALPLTE